MTELSMSGVPDPALMQPPTEPTTGARSIGIQVERIVRRPQARIVKATQQSVMEPRPAKRTVVEA
jgi:hypothetical protein